MPPPGHEPFLCAICADPADDTVRLAYADWLDENGDPDRAECIRLQIAVPERPDESDPDLRFFRGLMLFMVNKAEWMGELPLIQGVTWHDRMRRGFVYGAVVRSGRVWVEHCEEIVRAVPLQTLTLRDASESAIEKALDCPQVGQLTELALLNSRMIHNQVSAVTNGPMLTELRTLTILRPSRRAPRRVTLSIDEARTLVRTPFLPKLEEIRLDGSISREAEQLLLTRFKKVRLQRRPR